MTVTVVVPVAGRPVHLARTLRGLADQRRQPDRTVVVDMGHADLEEAPIPVRRVTVASAGSALPLALARNVGAGHADEGQLVFLDVDCIPHPDLVGDHVAALDRVPEAVACGRVRYLRPGWADGPGPIDLDARSDPHPTRPAPPDDVLDTDRHELFWSLNFAVTTVTWRRVGGFDTGYCGYGAEDTDLGLRAAAAGIPLLWVAGATAYHQWHPPSRLDPARLPEIVANARRFHSRWGRWPMVGWLDELAAAGTVRFDAAADVLEVVER
jgi:N-acetylglucosaminyl-diphospho-decaprenol L-rhamnosyltransferase